MKGILLIKVWIIGTMRIASKLFCKGTNKAYTWFLWELKEQGLLKNMRQRVGMSDADDNTFNSLTVESNGGYIDDSFNRFYNMVLHIER